MYPLLQFENVSFFYSEDRIIFEDLSFSINAGEFIVLEGESGSGKSTLLRLLTRLEEPTNGSIRFQGNPLVAIPPYQLRRHIAYIQQEPVLLPGSIRENLLLPFSFKVNHDLKIPSDSELRSLLAEFLLDEIRLSESALNLSGGQRQRLCFLRALLLKPKAMLLDEPTSALDKDARKVVEQAVARLNRDHGITIIVASHRGFESLQTTIVTWKIKERRIVAEKE